MLSLIARHTTSRRACPPRARELIKWCSMRGANSTLLQLHSSFPLTMLVRKPRFFSTTRLLKFPVTPGANVTTANIMKDWFLSFAIYLDPGQYSWSGVKKPDWEMYHSDGNRNARVMSVNYTEVGMVDDRYFDQTKQCEFLWKNGAIVQNKR